MFTRRTRSALFIDYENVAHQSLPSTIANWLSWLEAGEFDEEKRARRFVEKRIYWNTTAEQHREKFAAAGFTPVLCEKFFGLKNGADIRIVLDAYDMLVSQPRISEFIFISLDTDYVPLLQRLAQKSKQTAILVSEQSPHAHATYSRYADTVIPLRKFMAATQFAKPRQTFAQWLRTVATLALQRKLAAPRDLIGLATDHVIRVTSLKPSQYTSRAAIDAELRKMKEFWTTGKGAYLGKGRYRDLMQEVAKTSERIVLDFVGPQRILNVRYVPKDEED
jgi:uncharacterized LabA/DUF88 family protein